MTDRLVDRGLRAFSDDLASARPVPGGGSASAYAGVLGAALATMVARIASKKEPGIHDEFIAEAESIRAELLRLVDDDSAAFARVAAAMKLPRSTDEDKQSRTEQLQVALLGAAKVPLEIARAGRRLLEACEKAAAWAPPIAASDIGVAALMAEAAARGAALNVMINLASLTNAAHVKELSEDLDRALEGTEDGRKRVLDAVESRIAR
jgi:glutamate formiminotransferase/formiminotetrahydrofolate cyclodeaminase